MTRIEQCTQAHFKSLLHAVGACGSTEAIARSIDAEQADGRDVVRRPREDVGDVHGDMLDDLEIGIALCKYPKWNWFVCTKNG